ncbi:hypothetical protein ACOSQ3_009535 [Xanthoceras sorbifolium]
MENEEFTFPIISGGDNTCPSSIDSPPLWRLSPAASPVPRLREARGENKSDDDDDDDDEEEEKMDVLWEDFNEELEGYNKKSNTSARDDHHMVELGCVPALKFPSKTNNNNNKNNNINGAIFSSSTTKNNNKPGVVVFIKVLKRFFLLHHHQHQHHHHHHRHKAVKNRIW